MKLFHYLISLALFPVTFSQQISDAPSKNKVWDFNNFEGWTLNSQDDNPDNQASISNGCLKIFTKKGSLDRKKARTNEKIYTTGRYKWRTYVPKMKAGDQTSVGSWIYCDDKHEIDFEVGPGKAAERARLGAKGSELLAYMTTQGNPYSSIAVVIKPGWHIFELDLSSVNGKYKVQWLIDGKLKHTVQQNFGPEVAFYIFCSVENLKFVGDHPSTKDYTAQFDRVEYTWHS